MCYSEGELHTSGASPTSNKETWMSNGRRKVHLYWGEKDLFLEDSNLDPTHHMMSINGSALGSGMQVERKM